MMKRFTLLTTLLVLLTSSKLGKKDEGMFPLSDLGKINFKKAGFRISPQDIFNPNGVSLVNALVRVGGCTGSFVSPDGLIATNHHCAFSSAAAASTTEHDYIRDGFLARERGEEIKTTLTCRITESYVDVSSQVLEGIDARTGSEKRASMIAAKIKAIVAEEKTLNPDLEIEISEMFVGKSYTLFRYRTLKDIRLVYIPPRSLGEFGGESDNWVWPRHNGDFSFLRAYVAPDGAARGYAADNVPYQPVRYVKINPSGVKENDMVFILGYPGRTFRHQPAAFIEYQQRFVLPYISSHFDWQIRELTEIGNRNYAKSIAFSSRIKSLANVAKNYRGKIQGLQRTGLLASKKQEEKEMQAYIAKNANFQSYQEVLPKISNLYYDIYATANRDLWFDQMYQGSGVFYAAATIAYHRNLYDRLSPEDKKAYLEPENVAKIKKGLQQGYTIYDTLFDRNLLRKLLMDALALPANQKVEAIENLVKGAPSHAEAIDKFLDKVYGKTKLLNQEAIYNLLETNPKKFLSLSEPIIELAKALDPVYQTHVNKRSARQTELNALLPQYLDIKLNYKSSGFIPDANSTLRLTYGYVKGFTPKDGEYNKPFTTIKGILQKQQDSGDYYLPEYLEEIYLNADKGPFVAPFLGDVPVGFLYNMDTTGGNSGSPVFNASGELIGINFDRAFTATINDYAWNNEYSRSIGVDIRYVLYVLKNVAQADHLLQEMGVPQ